MNAFRRSVWMGSHYERRGRSVVLDAPAFIFRCPLCEYRMTALAREGIDTIRRTHVRTCHTDRITELAALDTIDRVPAHLRKDPV